MIGQNTIFTRQISQLKIQFSPHNQQENNTTKHPKSPWYTLKFHTQHSSKQHNIQSPKHTDTGHF
jgi:hypothetical protein